MLNFTFTTCGSLNMSISKTNHVENIIKANQHNNTDTHTDARTSHTNQPLAMFLFTSSGRSRT